MNKIKFAIIGCGMIAHTHADAILDISVASLIGAWDLDATVAKEFCKKYNLSQYNSFEDILADEHIDAVCICTPSFCHKDQAMAALLANKHVVLEKPMALSLEDANELCDVADKAERKLTVMSQNRFSEDIIYLKKLIDEKAFGTLCFCDLYMKFNRDKSYYADSTWHGKMEYDGGGALMNQGIHGVDILNYLVGKAKLISGRVKTLVHNIEVEDSAVAMLEYDCGALGVIEASTCSAPGFTRRIEINGERGYAVLCDTTIETLYIDGETIISKKIDKHPRTAASPMLAGFEMHKAQITNFINAISGEEALVVTPSDGCYAVGLIKSIYKSSDEHKKEL